MKLVFCFFFDVLVFRVTGHRKKKSDCAAATLFFKKIAAALSDKQSFFFMKFAYHFHGNLFCCLQLKKKNDFCDIAVRKFVCDTKDAIDRFARSQHLVATYYF